MNGEKMEFPKGTTLDEIRIAAANKLDPKCFFPEILILKGGKKLGGECGKVQHDELDIVADCHIKRNHGFWCRAIKAHNLAGDADGVERAVVEMNQATRNAFLIDNAKARKGFDREVCLTELLLKHGANVDAMDEEGSTSLHIASKCGDNGMVDLLVGHGADVNRGGQYGRTSLIVASLYGKTDTVALLIKYGADVNASDEYGNTSLMWASGVGDTNLANLLIQHGADVNAANWLGETILMRAIKAYSTDTVALLLKHGAKVNYTSLGIALKLRPKDKRTDIVRLLHEHRMV